VGERELEALVSERIVERVPPDRGTAEKELDAAHRHIASAALVAQSDPAGAFAMGYDAIRKAIAAHMRARGYRVRSAGGHHRRVGQYAIGALDDAGVAHHIEAFDHLRRLRNQSQYDGLEIEPDEVVDLLVHARAIVAAVDRDLGVEGGEWP
jgi:hypothetical protein